MGKKLSEEVIESDSDESMQDAPVNEKKNAEVSSNEESTNSSSEADSSDESSSETQNNNTARSSSNRKKAFVPPSGFRPSKMKSQPSAAISSVLSNLEGKQVFHITAPSYLPLSEIKQIDFGKATSGESILSHKGVDYGLVENSRQQKQGSETLLVYDEKTNTFLRKPELRKIESYNIQEIVRLPGLDTLVPSSIAQDATNKQAGARPQPKHLRMRFHPVGSSNLPPETVGSSSESEADQPPTSHGPSTSSKEKDRKRKTAEQQNGTEEKAKKSKKEKQQLSTQVEAESEGRRDKEKKKSSKHRDETSQERRARKEEKKKRKAEKEK